MSKIERLFCTVSLDMGALTQPFSEFGTMAEAYQLIRGITSICKHLETITLALEAQQNAGEKKQRLATDDVEQKDQDSGQRQTYNVFPAPALDEGADGDIKTFWGEAHDVDRFLCDLRKWVEQEAADKDIKPEEVMTITENGASKRIMEPNAGIAHAVERMVGPRVKCFTDLWKIKCHIDYRAADWGAFEEDLRRTFGPI